MYKLPYFKEKDQGKVFEFIKSYPFAFLTGSTLAGRQVATQVPILVEEREGELFLQGHIMKNSDHYKAFSENPQALAVFTGPNTYISASWYSNPKMGSTWNYMSVHIDGKISFMNTTGLIAFMRKLTLEFEDGNSLSPSFYDNLPNDFLNNMMPAIVGFELKADTIENVFKLSQNRDEKSYQNIISKLEKKGGDAAVIASEMRGRKEELFLSNPKID